MEHQIPTLTGDPGPALPEFDRPPSDPITLLTTWISQAVSRGVREPLAVILATSDEHHHTSSRTILIKTVDHRGLLFGTHQDSRKGRDLTIRPWAAMTFYWRETLQQINLAGPVAPTSDQESDHLFHNRPTAAQAATAASHQSQPLRDEAELRRRTTALDTGQPLPRPPHWFGYRLLPHWIEFWHGSPDRLHRRLRYDRTPDGWQAVRLQP